MPQPNMYPALHINPPNVLGKMAQAARTNYVNTQNQLAQAEMAEMNRLAKQRDALRPLYAGAASGDMNAIRGIAAHDPKLAGQYMDFSGGIEDRQREQQRAQVEDLGRLVAAYEAMPPLQRASSWPQIRQMAAQMGVEAPQNPPDEAQIAFYKSQLAEASKVFQAQGQLKSVGGLILNPDGTVNEDMTARSVEYKRDIAEASAIQIGGPEPKSAIADLKSDLDAGHITQADYDRQLKKKLDYTESQYKNAGYADQMVSAEQRMQSAISNGYNPASGEDYLLREWIPGGNYGRTPAAQMYWSALEEFSTGVVRPETGAAVTKEDMLNTQRRYFPMPGDSPQTQQDKRTARQRIMQIRKRQGGGAYEEMFGPQRAGSGSSIVSSRSATVKSALQAAGIDPDKSVQEMDENEIKVFLRANGIEPEE